MVGGSVKITAADLFWLATVKVHRDTLSAKELAACERVRGWKWKITKEESNALWAFIEAHGKVPDYSMALGSVPTWYAGW